MKSRLLDYDSVHKVRRMFHPSADGDSFIEEGTQDITKLISGNKILQTAYRPKKFGDGRRMASIPIVIWEDLMRRGITTDAKKLKAWLNDPDNRAFRTMLGRI